MEAFLVSTGLVALAEMGDKTQLLSLVLAARLRRPLLIILGITAATLANHGLAAAAGTWITSTFGPDVLRWGVGLSFIAMGLWTLIPDKLDEGDVKAPRFGVFGATFVAFFLAEMGDKTQIATIALAAQFAAFYSVVAGSTLGMLIANVPAVLLGDKITQLVPLRSIRNVAAIAFVLLGALALLRP